jgi:hypothetical protein
MSGGALPPCWIPERIVTDGSGAQRCRWIDVAGVRFTDPFFDSTVRQRRRDAHGERWSTVAELLDEAATVPAVNEVVFIFHVSRCGSTLMSQLFGLDEQALVLSETPLLDTVLQTDPSHRERLFEAALRLLCRPRGGVAPRVVVKTDAWHLFQAATLRRLYPQARFVLLYRQPAAVLGSHHKMRGTHMVPGLLDAAFHVPYDPEKLTLDQYSAIVLGRLYQAMLDVAAADDRSLLVSYEQGFPDAFLRTADWLGLSFDADRLRQIQQRCGYHAKRPNEAFGAETLPSLQGVDLRRLDSLLTVLDQRRAATGPLSAT